MKRGRCAIIRPRPEGRQWEKEEPLGAEAICGYLRVNGIECRVFDRRLGAMVNTVEAYHPDAVGFSLMTQEDIPDALRLLSRLRQPGRVFFAGGLFVTTEAGRCRALFPDAVHLIPGEGEAPVLALLSSKNANYAPSQEYESTELTDDIASESSQSCDEKSPAQETKEQMLLHPDEWAFPSRDDLPAYLAGGGVIHLRSARGCRGGCRFCTTPGQARGRHQVRSLALVVEEMALLAAQGYPPIFNFTDDEFGDLERIEELTALLEKAKLRAAFSLELRPSVMCGGTPEIWKRLHEGGLCRVFTGLENLDPGTLKRWGKAGDPLRIIEAVQQCRRAGILCETGYILFHAGSTARSVREQLQILHENGLFTPKAALSRLVLYPGSRLHAESGKQGAALEELQPDTQRLYDSLSEELAGLYNAWTECAVRLPNAACRAFLTGDDCLQRKLEKSLAVINEEAFGTVCRLMRQAE